MRGIGRTARAAALLGATLAAAAATAPTAFADTGLETSSGSCSAGAYFANYSVTYDQLINNPTDRVDGVDWTIGGPVGTHNNVEVRVKYDNSRGHDPIYYTWISGDDVQGGDTFLDWRTEGIEVPTAKPMYVEFKFTFDVPGEGDKSCTGHTRNV